MATVKPEGLVPPKKYFFKTVIILNYHVKFQVDITNIKEKVSAHRCLAIITTYEMEDVQMKMSPVSN